MLVILNPTKFVTEPKKSQNPVKDPGFFLPMIGIEPIQDCSRQILSLLRLPIPPHRHYSYPSRLEKLKQGMMHVNIEEFM